MAQKPDYVASFKKPPNTEIKLISGKWYLYRTSCEYDKESKRPRKKSGEYLGAIKEDGFHPRRGAALPEVEVEIEVKEAGATSYFYKRCECIRTQLQVHFPDCWQQLFAIALIRAVHESPLNRIADRYECSILSEIHPELRLSKDDITPLLQRVGRDRKHIRLFMVGAYEKKSSSFMLFDGHRLISHSETLESAHLGYDSKMRFEPQSNLICAFSIDGSECFPAYYKAEDGDVIDSVAFSDVIAEMGMDKKNVAIIGDKGFNGEGNIDLMEDKNLNYVLPLKRNSSELAPLMPVSEALYQGGFTYAGRPILFKDCMLEDGRRICIFLDQKMRQKEMGDSFRRTARLNAENLERARKEEERRTKGWTPLLSDERLAELKCPVDPLSVFGDPTRAGTLSLITNIASCSAEDIYQYYKKREWIEDFFRIYDNTLDFDSSFMRDRYSFEAWLFLNHLSSLMAYDALHDIKSNNMLKNLSFKDFRVKLSSIAACRSTGEWKVQKLTDKRKAFLSKFNVDIEGVLAGLNTSA